MHGCGLGVHRVPSPGPNRNRQDRLKNTPAMSSWRRFGPNWLKESPIPGIGLPSELASRESVHVGREGGCPVHTLSLDQIEQARVKVLENARELIAEAEMLLANGKCARTYLLSHIASEEISKLAMLFRAGVQVARGEHYDWNKLQRRMQSHREKITVLPFFDYMFGTPPDEPVETLVHDLGKVSAFNDTKNQSLYVGQLDGNFYKPSEVITQDLAVASLDLARKRLKTAEMIEARTAGKLTEIATDPIFSQLREKLLSWGRARRRGK